MPRFPLLLLLLGFVASPLLAGYSGRDLVLPVVGRGAGAQGRLFSTTLWLTNVSPRAAAATLTFLTTVGGKPKQFVSHARLAPSETKLIEELGPETLGAEAATGALRVQADADLLANARLTGRFANETPAQGIGMSCAGIPSQFAIGPGDSATMQGIATGDYRTKLYVIETTGRPLGFAVALLDPSGREVRRRMEYVAGFEYRGVDLRELFPDAGLTRGILRLTGLNGNGRIIAGAAQITAGSADGTFFEMSLETKPRWRMGGGEVAVYGVVALVIIVAAFVSRSRGTRHEV